MNNENNYYSEIKEALKGCKDWDVQSGKTYIGNKKQKSTPIVKCGEFSLEYNKNVFCKYCKSLLQTHLLYAKKDLIEIEKDIEFSEGQLFNWSNVKETDMNRDLFYIKKNENEKLQQKQLRKIEIEEVIKLLKEKGK